MDKAKILNQVEIEEDMRKAREKDALNIASKYKKLHSLDSDEEDEEETARKYNVLDPNELEGQEEDTIDHDGEIKITPFNMKEELEEGYFDKEGTYIFKKEDGVIKDQWLEDIDWIKVKTFENKRKKAFDNDSDEELPKVNVYEHYKNMLTMMKPKETVQSAICRLGNSHSTLRTAGNRWKRKKEGKSSDVTDKNEDVEHLQLLTSLANDIVQSGDMDIYLQTYEKLAFHVNLKENKSSSDVCDDKETLDMFGDDFDESSEDKEKVSTSSLSTHEDNKEKEIMWEFKWEASDGAKIYGPYPTSQMLQWVQQHYFEDGVHVRQIGKQDGQFYLSKRIDFELYL